MREFSISEIQGSIDKYKLVNAMIRDRRSDKVTYRGSEKERSQAEKLLMMEASYLTWKKRMSNIDLRVWRYE